MRVLIVNVSCIRGRDVNIPRGLQVIIRCGTSRVILKNYLNECTRNWHTFPNVYTTYITTYTNYTTQNHTAIVDVVLPLQHSIRTGLRGLTKCNNRMVHAVHLSNARKMCYIRYAHKVKFREVYYIPWTWWQYKHGSYPRRRYVNHLILFFYIFVGVITSYNTIGISGKVQLPHGIAVRYCSLLGTQVWRS